MIKIQIISFKHGLFWYSCCEIPAEEKDTFYYDNTSVVTLESPAVLHAVGLTFSRTNKKLINKIKSHFNEKESRNDGCYR